MSIQLSDLSLSKDDIITYIKAILEEFNNFDGIVGDVPVSEQLSAALSRMAAKEHTHDDYITRKEYESLKRDVNKLLDLVGDVPVSEQISASIDRIK